MCSIEQLRSDTSGIVQKLADLSDCTIQQFTQLQVPHGDTGDNVEWAALMDAYRRVAQIQAQCRHQINTSKSADRRAYASVFMLFTTHVLVGQAVDTVLEYTNQMSWATIEQMVNDHFKDPNRRANVARDTTMIWMQDFIQMCTQSIPVLFLDNIKTHDGRCVSHPGVCMGMDELTEYLHKSTSTLYTLMYDIDPVIAEATNNRFLEMYQSMYVEDEVT